MGSNGRFWNGSGPIRSGKQGEDLLKEEEKTLNIWCCREFGVTRRRHSTQNDGQHGEEYSDACESRVERTEVHLCLRNLDLKKFKTG